MITVAVLINGQPIATRSAVNVGEDPLADLTIYKSDDGSIVTHRRTEGALVLARKLLDLIHEVEKP